MLQEPDYVHILSTELKLQAFQIQIVISLLEEGSTVPFIARYRKERTGNLDETHIREIIDLKNKTENLYKIKQTAINGIEQTGKMRPDLMQNILKAKTLKEVEEIYKPYKSKKKTKAMIAIEQGFQPVADFIKTNISFSSLPLQQIECEKLLEQHTEEEILEGCIHIISAEISSQTDLRSELAETLMHDGLIESKFKTHKSLGKLNIKDKGQISKFDLYKDFSRNIHSIKPYQILALNRGEKLGILSVKIDKSEEIFKRSQSNYSKYLSINTPFTEVLSEAFKSGFSTLFKSVENELRGVMSEKGEDDAIQTFQKNLGQLLMTKPEYGHTILAMDPGFRAGCKIAVLDNTGNPVYFDKIFLHSKTSAQKILNNIISQYHIDVIVIGNGTGSNETVELLSPILEDQNNSTLRDSIFIVNESGASVYSASKTAAEEFPDLDSLDRGTVSIGRRYIDPLSELVKIPVGSIGVGMYQHDIPEKKLEERLGFVVEDTVNEVGIHLNTASSYVLNHISGINKTIAKKIYKNRPYKSREELKKYLSASTYEQSAGFLRIPESKETLDNTDIHPSQYPLARYIQKNSHHISISNEDTLRIFFETHKQQALELYPDTTLHTIHFILDSLDSAGADKRIYSTHKKASLAGAVNYKLGDIVDGVVRNVVAFGAFVDIGMKNDGLVHVSQIADRFISDPREEIEVGQAVRVKITGIDAESGKIQLSIKDA